MRLGENGHILLSDMEIVIGVIGAGYAEEEERATAFEVGKEIARKRCALICGGKGGVMEAACRGAKTERGLTIGVIPDDFKNDANPYVDIPVVTGMGHGRNIIVVRSSDALIAIGGGFGTLSEIAFALRLEIPVVGIKTWDVSSEIKRAEYPGEAVEMAVGLARNRSHRGMR
ncbi:MAG: TIGR00725 family protein [Thermodesulfobacteriota bacterium]